MEEEEDDLYYMYIKALLSYTLKMASCKPKHVASVFF